MNEKNISNFPTYLGDKHYAHSTVRQYCGLLDRLDVDGCISDPAQLFEHINKLLGRLRCHASKPVSSSTKAVAGRYFEMITGVAFAAFEMGVDTDSAIESILSEFLEYSTGFKNIKLSTAKAECSHLRTFLQGLDTKTLQDFSAVTAPDVRDYATNSLSSLKTSSTGRYITSLRNFFRFLEYKGAAVNPSVFNLPLSSADRNNARIPVTLTREEEYRLRTHEFRNDGRGSRNRAILMLMLDLGLRCAEIPNIHLSDIRWGKGTIIVNGAKNHICRELPMSKAVGMAAEDYVPNYRPRTFDGCLFLNINPCCDHSPVTVGTVRSLIRYLYKCEDISGW